MIINPFLGSLLGNTFVGLGIVVVVFLLGFFEKKITRYIDYITALTVGLLI